MPSFDTLDTLFEVSLPLERTRLISLCAQLTGDWQAAEDLAQETLLEAWRHRHKLYDHTGWQKWINAIARNVCLRWLHERRTRYSQLITSIERDEYADGGSLEEQLADEFDIEIELERAELARLLDRALAELPSLTRSILIQRFIHDSPYAEIAAQLRVSEEVVAQRVHRGKLTMRRVLTSELQEDAIAFGLVSESAEQWQRTRIWCVMCGRAHLLACWKWNRTLLLMRCPICNHDPESLFLSSLDRDHSFYGGVKGFKAALSRLYKWAGRYIRPGMRDVACIQCGQPVQIRIGPGYDLPPQFPPGGDNAHVYTICATCGSIHHLRLPDYLLALPEGQQFVREHPHMRVLPEREIETAGGCAVVTRFQSRESQAHIDFITPHNLFEIIDIFSDSRASVEVRS